MRFALLCVAACAGPTGEPDWMGRVADDRSLAALSIPGTHDAGARFEPYLGLAQAQTLTLAEQLAAGVRYLDLRCRDVDDQFLIYHGGIDQNQTFDEALATILAFLDAHPTETVIASVKEEAAESGATRPFDATFRGYVAMAPDRWYVDAAVPRLGDARGRLVLLRRFASTVAPLGIDAAPWADDATFQIANGDATLAIEDEYVVADNDAKWAAITAHLDAAATGDPAILSLTYTSGYQTVAGLPDIRRVADDIDARLDARFATPATARTGVVVMDFALDARAAAIIATND